MSRTLLLVFFGLPGAGKTYAARVIAHEFGLTFHDGDDDLPQSMVEAIAASRPITDDQRDEFFAALIAHVGRLRAGGKSLIVAQTFIKEKYRRQLRDAFPEALFVLVEAPDDVRERRLAHRADGTHLEPGYARRMATLFEAPGIPYDTLTNESDGSAHLIAQARSLFIKP